MLSTDFKKEDLVRTLLNSMCQVLVAMALNSCLITKVKHIFAAGGFLSHPLTERIVMQDFEFRKYQRASSSKDFVSTAQFRNNEEQPIRVFPNSFLTGKCSYFA